MKAYKSGNTYKPVKDTIRTYYKRTTFTSSGSYTVPSGITKLKIDCVASKGMDGTSVGGNGGRVQCNLTVNAGDALYITIGAVPTNIQTASYNASDIRIGGTELTNRVIVAGGGGNGGTGNWTPCGSGGAGGELIGGVGTTGPAVGSNGTGGTQSIGGSAGGVSGYYYGVGSGGTLGLGGNGGSYGGGYSGGAGGAGYYGGGGGSSSAYYTYCGSGGGGGSSYTNSNCSNVVHTQGYNNGAGYVYIDYPSTSSDYDYYVDENTYKAFNI